MSSGEPATLTPALTAEDLQEYWRLNERRKELAREARTLEKRGNELLDRFLAAMRAEGVTSGALDDFVLVIEDKRLSVAWKAKFVEHAGADAAVAIEQAQPVGQRVKVTKAA